MIENATSHGKDGSHSLGKSTSAQSTSARRLRGTRSDSASRQGIALIMVMVLIILISLGAYTFTDMMIAEERATVMAGRQLQAQAAVASGVEYVKAYLTLTPDDQVAVGGHWDNPNYFRDVALDATDGESLRFAVVSVEQDQYGEPTNWRYGLEDEGGKICNFPYKHCR